MSELLFSIQLSTFALYVNNILGQGVKSHEIHDLKKVRFLTNLICGCVFNMQQSIGVFGFSWKIEMWNQTLSTSCTVS